jgi:hypothetical protein
MKTVLGHTCMCAASTEELVAPWRTVSTDNIDLAAGIVQGRSQVVEQIEQTRIEMVYLSRAMVAEIVVKFGQRLRDITITTPIDDIESLVGVGVIKAQPVFGRGCAERIQCLPQRRNKR